VTAQSFIISWTLSSFPIGALFLVVCAFLLMNVSEFFVASLYYHVMRFPRGFYCEGLSDKDRTMIAYCLSRRSRS